MSTLAKTPVKKTAARKPVVAKARPFRKFFSQSVVSEAAKRVRLDPNYDFTQPTGVLGK